MPAQTLEIPKRWPLVQSFYTRSPNLPVQYDARVVNGYAEKDPADNEYWVYKRPGVGSIPFATPLGFPGGTYYYNPSRTLLSVAGGYLYNSNTVVGSVGGSFQCWFETINSNPQTIAVMNPSSFCLYTPSTGTFNNVSATTANQYPGTVVPGIAYLDGTTYVMDSTGNIWGSAGLNNAVTWDPLNVIAASARADGGVFLATQLSYVIAFKQWTTQVFYDAANATGSPLGPVPDATIPYGCLSALSVQKIDETLFWLSANQSYSPQVIMMENLGPQIISTPSVERLLNNLLLEVGIYKSQVNLYSWVFQYGGHRFYGITSLTQNFTLVYDVDQKLWYQWTDAYGNCWNIGNFTYIAPSPLQGGILVGQLLTGGVYPGTVEGNLYEINSSYVYSTDLGYTFPVDIFTPNFTGGTTRRKHLNMMYFDTDQVRGSKLKARYSDDDYQSWSNFRSIDLSLDQPYLDQEGTFTKRAYHFRHESPTVYRMKAGELQIDIGTL